MSSELMYLEQMEKALTLQLGAIRERKEALLLEESRRQEMENVPEMVTIPEAQKRSGMSRITITELCKSGAVKHIRIGDTGKRILVNYGSLHEYIHKGEQVKGNARTA